MFWELSDYGRMSVNIEFFLAGHPRLLFGRESSIKGLHSGSVSTAIGCGAGDIHPGAAVQRTGNQFPDQKGCGVIAGLPKLIFTS